MNELHPPQVFVYGTLKRGEERERCWPHPPWEILPATLLGELRDLGLYPALIHGADRVAGEVWQLSPEHVEDTLRVLDAIEGYREGSAENLYQRQVVQCTTADGRKLAAFTYFYADEAAARQACRVTPNASGVCNWTAK